PTGGGRQSGMDGTSRILGPVRKRIERKRAFMRGRKKPQQRSQAAKKHKKKQDKNMRRKSRTLFSF
ncbi:MAG TPA: hypothetical protein VN641_00715, partial [Urbifossiella sp.]|nr:hypothetical protein [Urbifossiella sp.]